MLVAFTLASQVHNLFHTLFSETRIPEVDLVFEDLISFQVCVLEKPWRSEAKRRSRHVDTSNCNHVARCTFSRKFGSSVDFHEARNMTDWNLVAGLLNLNVLKALKFARAIVHNQISFHVVGFALVAGTLNQRIELELVDSLVYFVATGLTCIHSDSHERLYVGRTRNYTTNRHKRANLLGADFTHFCGFLFAKLAGNNHKLVGTFELLWNLIRIASGGGTWPPEPRVYLGLHNLLVVIVSLLHEHIECAEVFFSEIDGGLRQIFVHHFRQQLYVANTIMENSIYETRVSGSAKEFSDIVKLNFNELAFFIGNALLKNGKMKGLLTSAAIYLSFPWIGSSVMAGS